MVGRTALSVAVLLMAATPVTALADRHDYRFAKVVDDVGSGFDPGSLGCPAINDADEVAFTASRDFAGGLYRVGKNGKLTTIAEDRERFLFLHLNPSLNDRGHVAFSAVLANGSAIMVGDGNFIRPVASSGESLQTLGPETSINSSGEVAFTGMLPPERDNATGVFSADLRGLTTHYATDRNVLVDGRPMRFRGFASTVSINDRGDVAFLDYPVGETGTGPGVYVGREGRFRTIAPAHPPNVAGGPNLPVLNDRGTAAFEMFFLNAAGEPVNAIVKGNGGPLRIVADTLGGYSAFNYGFRPPALNDDGDVAFVAYLDDGSTKGIYTGPDPTRDKVVQTGDTLDGATVAPFGVTMCEGGLNDAGVVTFVANFEDPTGLRSAIYRAVPRGRS